MKWLVCGLLYVVAAASVDAQKAWRAEPVSVALLDHDTESPQSDSRNGSGDKDRW